MCSNNGDTLVIESEQVVKYIAHNVAPLDDGMYPRQDSKALNRVDKFLQQWSVVVDDYYSCLTATTEADANLCLVTFSASLQDLESILASADGPFLLGQTFSAAECNASPWVQRFFVTLPYFRSVDFDHMVVTDFPSVASWMKAVRTRPSVVNTACPETEMCAAVLRYYVSYISPGAPGAAD